MKTIKFCYLLILGLSSLFSSFAKAEAKASIYIKPQQCVALHQGQVCYVTVDLEWHSSETGSYCLYLQGQANPLQCWQNVSNGRYSKSWSTADKLSFWLGDGKSDRVLAKADMTVSWVYRKKQKSRLAWRLF